jgi:hypothetical protein
LGQAVDAKSLSTILVALFADIPIAGWVVTFGARGFNHLDKYTLHTENTTNGKITNITETAELMFYFFQTLNCFNKTL